MSEFTPDYQPAYNPQHPEFVPLYQDFDEESGEVHTSPFEVLLTGFQDQFFGAATIIGSIDGDPVIEVTDANDNRPYFVMGFEVWWTYLSGVALESTANLKIDSIADYRKELDASMKHRDEEDEPNYAAYGYCQYHRQR